MKIHNDTHVRTMTMSKTRKLKKSPNLSKYNDNMCTKKALLHLHIVEVKGKG